MVNSNITKNIGLLFSMLNCPTGHSALTHADKRGTFHCYGQRKVVTTCLNANNTFNKKNVHIEAFTSALHSCSSSHNGGELIKVELPNRSLCPP